MTDTPIFCNQCGQQSAAGATFCTRCGASLVSAGSAAMPQTPLPGATFVARQYGGFWIRFVAALIDGIIIWAVFLPLRLVFGGAFGLGHALGGQGDIARNPAAIGMFAAMMSGMALVNIVADWVYSAYFESSERQATLGKMALGLKVTDLNGNRISFAQATGRHFAKWVSAIILMIGFIMAGFTDRKQALHDMIAGTLVVKN